MPDYPLRLTKYVAHAGVGTRREAAELISRGEISVNGVVVLAPYTFINEGDEVKYQGRQLVLKEKAEYYVLNKPRGYATDTKGDDKKSVRALIDDANPNLNPAGHLGYKSTGLVIMTNDEELTAKLVDPSHPPLCTYEVKMDQTLSAQKMEEIRKGDVINSIKIIPHAINYIEGRSKNKAVVRLHSLDDQTVFDLFAHYDLEVKSLDRTTISMITKKGISQGKSRSLFTSEVNILKHLL